MVEQKEGWTFENQLYYPQLGEGDLSPDGRSVVFTVREPLLTDEASKYIHNLYLVAADGGQPVQLTFGEHNNTMPRWSPDGRYIAFLSTRVENKANLYVMRADGGEAWPLTRYDKTAIIKFAWSPDGQSLAFLMCEPPSEDKEKAKKAKDDYVRWDIDFEFAHLYRVPFAVGPRQLPEVKQITAGRFHIVEFDWLPDGSRLALSYTPTPVAEDWPRSRLALVSAVGESQDQATLTDIALVASWLNVPKASPDGRWIACNTTDLPARWAFASRIVLYPTDGGDPRPLAETPDLQPGLIGWAADSQSVFVVEANSVNTQLYALPISGEEIHQLTEADLHKWSMTSNAAGQILMGEQDFDQINRLAILDPETRTSRVVAEPPLSACWPDAPLPRAEVIRWAAPDGLEIEGIVIYPHDHRPGRPYPLIVEVHGGPAGVYSRGHPAVPDRYGDIISLTERGFVILRANPRGSSGYGKDFRFANYGDWGGGDYQDIMAGVDYLIERGIADSNRLGILGWSYGGFMTSWVITQTNRFKAACVGAGVTNLMSFNGTADIPGFIPDYFDGEFWDDLEPYRSHSPLFQVKGVTTPTLIQHGEADIRVPLSQGRELYNALKRQNVPVEMVIYPRQGHAVSEPRLRLDVRRRAVAWFEKWILGKPEEESS